MDRANLATVSRGDSCSIGPVPTADLRVVNCKLVVEAVDYSRRTPHQRRQKLMTCRNQVPAAMNAARCSCFQ